MLRSHNAGSEKTKDNISGRLLSMVLELPRLIYSRVIFML